ncbi:hypothetical protein LCGC14_3166760, partial [marine sediment metagenome]
MKSKITKKLLILCVLIMCLPGITKAPLVNCTEVCGDFGGPVDTEIDIYDYMAILGEYGVVDPIGLGKGCIDLVADGAINIEDLQAWHVGKTLSLCNPSPVPSVSHKPTALLSMSKSLAPPPPPTVTGPTGLLIFGKPAAGSSSAYIPNSYIYGVEPNGVTASGPSTPACPSGSCTDVGGIRYTDSGRLVTDSHGNSYQVSSEYGIIKQDTGNVVAGPNDNIAFNDSIVSVSILFDAAFSPDDNTIVYVVPVYVGTGENYHTAAAKLQLSGDEDGNYELLELYGNEPNGLCEIEIDLDGNLFVLSAHYGNNRLLIYD